MAKQSPKTDTQVALFPSESKTIYLHVVKDGAPAALGLAEIFDPIAYEELLAVTYVSSPAFFFRTARDFKRVVLILGIDDNDWLQNFSHNNPQALKEMLLPGDRLQWWKSLEPEIRDRIRDEHINIRYGKINVLIHSKLYLLRGPTGNRLVLGSANFTQSALSGTRQFEELLV